VRLGSRARDILCVLGEADVPGISFASHRGCGRYPRRQVWTGHRCGRLCRRRVYAALLGLPARW
jgi:hypothetical protein